MGIECINANRPSGITVRGTVEVSAAGYLPGDRVSVRMNGKDYPATVTLVTFGRVEVTPDIGWHGIVAIIENGEA